MCILSPLSYCSAHLAACLFSRPSTASCVKSISGAHCTPIYDLVRDFAICKKGSGQDAGAHSASSQIGRERSDHGDRILGWSRGACALDRCSSLCLCLTPRPCPSISCSRRPHPTCRRRVNRVTKVECNGNGTRLCPQYV